VSFPGPGYAFLLSYRLVGNCWIVAVCMRGVTGFVTVAAGGAILRFLASQLEPFLFGLVCC